MVIMQKMIKSRKKTKPLKSHMQIITAICLCNDDDFFFFFFFFFFVFSSLSTLFKSKQDFERVIMCN